MAVSIICVLTTSFPAAAACVQEGALTALASVADCAQEQFVRYYDAVMPLLSQILHNAQNKEHRWAWLRNMPCFGECTYTLICCCVTCVSVHSSAALDICTR
jgi:hypothetical protein